MDGEGMKTWIDKVWCSRRGGLGRRRSLLVCDAFEAHVTERVKTALTRENTNLAVIPGGLTSILQPLDVSLNKPFKDGVRKRWMEWMAEGIHEFTASGRQKKPSEELILSWIAGAWQDISEEMIESSFLKCGITTFTFTRPMMTATMSSMTRLQENCSSQTPSPSHFVSLPS